MTTSMSYATVADRLRERASSYFADARRLKEEGNLPMWAAYEAIAGELRQVANEIDAGVFVA